MALVMPALGQTRPAWQRLPDLPDREGFAGMFGGVSGGGLIVAGGANFPQKKPWEGGKKVWYDDVFLLDRADGEWRRVGHLPRPLGYGISVTRGDSVICIGGGDAERNYADAFRIRWTDGRLVTTPLPPLPKPVANACGAVVGGKLFVAGGQETIDAREALASLFELDLAAKEPAWRELAPIPGGGRILAVAAALGDDFYVISGAALKPEGREYLNDAWRYREGQGWTRLPPLPHAVVAAPSPAPNVTSGIFILGGDDGTQVGVTRGHRGFSKQLLRFDVAAKAWRNVGDDPGLAVTAPCVRWNDAWVILSGEVLPGVRTPQVWSFTPTGTD
jgi:N-acetylneuraminic acid mutarotase